VDGPAGAADACAAGYAGRTGRPARPGLRNRLLRLVEPVPPAGVPGRQRRLTDADADQSAPWLAAFSAEALPHQPPVDGRVWLRSREGYGWEDRGVPVSLAVLSPQVAGVRRVGPVYTPPRWRGRGLAAANVHAAGRLALAAGATGVMLYADEANPVSNRVYERIGYRVLDRSHEWLFGS
jgi:RimJ/RimL family protein N-acetyltransferase